MVSFMGHELLTRLSDAAAAETGLACMAKLLVRPCVGQEPQERHTVPYVPIRFYIFYIVYTLL